jgi:hypothetical protein
MDLQQTDMPKTPFDVYELLCKILSFLPRSVFASEYNTARDSNMMCAGVCKNWLKVSRRLAFSRVGLKTEEEAMRFLAALISNEDFVELNPGWPRLNSTRTLTFRKVNGSFLILLLFI